MNSIRSFSADPGAKALVAAMALVLFPAGTGLAETGNKNPYAAGDRTWININGTVEAVEADAFELDYGDGVITVEMDDGDRDADAYQLLRGDTVSVTGMIDDDFFTSTSIEAASVYVEEVGTTFYASAVDDEDIDRATMNGPGPVGVSEVIVQGEVTDVSRASFVIDNGTRSIAIDVSRLGYDPLDDDGYQRIEVGDRVQVGGEITRDLFEDRELMADSVVEQLYGPIDYTS
jgi:hypothetical protein